MGGVVVSGKAVRVVYGRVGGWVVVVGGLVGLAGVFGIYGIGFMG